MPTEILISEVLMMWMLMPSLASAWNMVLATAACERMPTPTMDTLAMFEPWMTTPVSGGKVLRRISTVVS